MKNKVKQLLLLMAIALVMSNLVQAQNTYYSQGSNLWNTTANWNTNSGGGGSSPTASELISGTNNFVVQLGHTVSINDSMNINNLTVNGTMTYGTSTTGQKAVIHGAMTIAVTGVVNTGAFNATHSIRLSGGIANSGVLDFRNNSAQVVNLFLSGSQSIGGSGTFQFNNFEISSGTTTATAALNIDGSFIINSGTTFVSGNFTHTMAGTLSNFGTLSHGNVGTIVLDGTLVQNITQNTGFNNLEIKAGGVVVLAGQIIVNGNFSIAENTTVNTDNNHTFYKDFTVADGSSYNASNGEARFYGATAQAIHIGTNATFDRVLFRYAGTKTIYGDIVANDYSYIYSGTTVQDFDATGSHTFSNGMEINGTCNFLGTITLKGGTYRKGADNSPEAFTFGTGANVIIDGANNIVAGDSLLVSGNVSIESGYLVLNALVRGAPYNDTVDSKLIGTAGHTFVNNAGTIYLRGQDNFPEGFDSYSFESGTSARYDASMKQTVRGNITYGNLQVSNYVKTVDGPMVVLNDLNLTSPNTDSVQLNLGAFSHEFKASIVDNYDAARPLRKCNLVSSGTITMSGADNNQYIYARTIGKYTFNNLYFTNSNPTSNNTKAIFGTIHVTNDFSVSNSSANELLYVIFDINADNIVGGNNFTLGQNVQLRVSGTDNFETSISSFASVTLDANSTVRFDGVNQNIPGGIIYGNIELYGTSVKTMLSDLHLHGSISNVGYTPVLTNSAPGQAINIAGDWLLETAYVNLDTDCSVIFDGDDQIINTTTIPNTVLSGTGTKTLNGSVTFTGDLSIYNGIEFDADNQYITIHGNWDNNSTGTFHQAFARTTFVGAGPQNIEILNPATSKFYDVYIDKASDDTVFLLSNVAVERHFRFTASRGELNMKTYTLSIGGDWYIYDGSDLIFEPGAKLHFNGSDTEQLLRNYNAGTVYPDMQFSGSALKRLYDNTFMVSGNFIIDNTTVGGEWVNIEVGGNWVNNGGSFNHYRTVIFNGADQLIDGTNFDELFISGTGTKKLNGNISLTGWIRIDTLATLDASPDAGVTSYNITVEETWFNNEWNADHTLTGQFIPRKGTVTFIGNSANIYTGDSIDALGNGRTGKQFYNLTINNNDNNYYTRLYPINVGGVKTEGNDVRVLNNFTVTSGIFYTYWNNIYVGANFKNIAGYFQMNEYNGQNSTLTLEGGIGMTYEFDPGTSQYFRKLIIDGGATYQLTNNLTINGNNGDNGDITLTNGTLDLNNHQINMVSTLGDITIEAQGKIALDSAAVLTMPNNRYLRNQGGEIEIIGNEETPAMITSTGHFYFIQESGNLAAKYYVIENTTGNGLEIQDGTIDATNNLSNGAFNGGSGNSYLTLDGINLGAGISSTDVFFNTGPTYNVQRLSGTGVITFANASGTLSGAAYENDGGNLIDWSNPAGKYWDGGGDAISWNDGNNWEPNGIPDSTTNVYLDHTFVPGIYNVQISGSTARVNNLTLEAGATQIELSLNGANLLVDSDLTNKSGSVVSQTNTTDTLILRGNWFNAGTYTSNTSPVKFELLTGTYNINITDTIYQMFIDGASGVLVLGSNLYIKDSIALKGATLSTTSYDIHLAGDWVMDGGIFNPGNSDVYLVGDDAGTIQTIKGGEFNNLEFLNASPKEISANILVNNYFTINSGAFVDGKTSYIFVGQRWLNYAGEAGFDQTGGGTVVFNGTGASYIGVDADITTIFNNLTIQGSGTKYVRDSLKIKGNIDIQNGTNFYLNSDVQILGTGVANTLNVSGGTIYLLGEDNFPKDMETINIGGGVVEYRSDTTQYIYPTTYWDLRVRRTTVDSLNTKIFTGNTYIQNSLYVNDIETLLDVNGFEITLGGGIGFPTGGRQIAWNGGALTHVGGDWNIDADISTFNEFTKKGTGRVTMNADLDITGNVVFYDVTQLNMNTFKLNCSVADKNFTMGGGCVLHSYVADTGAMAGPAFPQGFTSYSIDETSTTYIRGNVDQEIFTGVQYGNLYLYDNANKTVQINNDLIVRGNFYMSYDGIVLNDNGNDIYIGGDVIEFRNYNPTNTIYLNKDGDQQIYANGIFTTLTLNNVDVSGSGTKNFNEPTIDINGNVTIHNGATMFSNDNIYFSGASFLNEGTFSHTANLVTFDGANQSINPGATNNFYGVLFSGTGTKTITSHGLDVYNGQFAIDNDVILDLGALTHRIASTTVDKIGTGTWLENNASFVFYRNGTQYIDSLVAQDITLSTSGYKYLRGDIFINNLTIESGTQLRTTETGTNGFDITLTGNWNTQGSFNLYDDTIRFESNNAISKEITSNGYDFNCVTFNQAQTSARTYLLKDNLRFNDMMTIGSSATLSLNGFNLTVGDNDVNGTTIPYVPDGEILTIEAGGQLTVNAGASLQFDLNDGNPKLDVYGTLAVVGSSGLNANITRSGGYDTRGAEINIYSGGHVKAEFYHIQYLAPEGFVVQNGATIDDNQNFSNGIWSNIYAGNQYTDPVDRITVIDTFVYLNIDADVVTNPIENLTFNHGGTPTVGRHFNIKRNGALLNTITIGGLVNGLMVGETYEMDPGSLIDWPPISILTWTGNQSTDWFDAQNWNPNIVPDETKRVLIPLVSNNPLIYAQGAKCDNLEITNGILGIESGVDSLVVNGSLQIGSDGILAVEDNAEIKVKGDWNIAASGLFLPGNSLVTFNAPVGSVVIESRGSKFNNLTFDGAASFFMEGVQNTVNGDFTLANGQFIPNDNNYTLTILGDYLQSGGDFVKAPNIGIIDFAGTDQTITNGDFSRVKFSNSGTKTLAASFSVSYASNTLATHSLWLSGSTTLQAGCAMNIAGNVYIDATATLNDGGNTHNFTGRFWTGLGNYTGAGTIEFTGRTQSLYASKFNHLLIADEAGTNQNKYLLGDITIEGNCTVSTYSLNADTYTITNSGSGNYYQGANSRIYIRGVNNFPANFASYDADPTSYAIYDGALNQTIAGATYGRLRFDGTNIKTLADDIKVYDEIYFYDRNVILDAANYTINIGGNWENRYSGTFIPGTGEVVFDGGSNAQNIYLGTSVDNPFYKISVDKSDVAGIVRPYIRDITIQNELLVHNGQFYTYNGYNTYINGNLIAQNNGTLSNTGTYVLNKASGIASLKMNGSVLNNLVINTTGTYNLLDNLELTGNFTLEDGIFNQNGNTAIYGNYLDIVNIYGEYNVGAGGTVKIGDGSTFNVKSGGIFKLVGDAADYTSVTNRTGTYYFNVESGAAIHANYYAFSYMRSAGIHIYNGASIDATNNFSNGTFSNPTRGGACLDIENTQEFFGAGSRIENVSFPDNPGGGTINVRKGETATGLLEFYNASGLLSGSDYESDPYNLIFWTGDVTLTWTGAISDDWFNAANWTASSGASIIPNESSTVIIPSGTANFPIIDADSAFAKTITINPNAFLFINNPTAAATSLFVLSNITINGTLSMTNTSDTLAVAGSWSRGTNGNFIAGNGTVVFNGVGSKSINNRNSGFNNLVVNLNGNIQILNNTMLTGDFNLVNGTFDVTTSNRTLTVGGAFINQGTFVAQSGKVILDGSGNHDLDPGTSDFYDLDIQNGNYTLINNNLYVNRSFDLINGSLNITALTFYMGDDSGYDDCSVSADLVLNQDAVLAVGNNVTINVYSGGLLSLLGTLNHEAIVTNLSTGRYGLTINSGGELQANFYKIEYMNATGLWFKPGAILSKTTNNLSNGTFANGASGGRYILFENNYTSDNDTVKITNIYFNAGATYNVKRVDASTQGAIQFKDAIGVLAGYFFEDDDNSSTTGGVIWKYTDPILIWVGGDISGSDTDGTRWDNPQNWQDQLGNPGVPSINTKVFINNVSAGSGKYPRLAAGTDTIAGNVTIYAGGSLTIGGNKHINVTGDLIISGTLQVENGSASIIQVGGLFSNSGSFIHGGASTIVWTTTNNNAISMNGDSFYNLVLNSGGDGSGNAIFSTESSLTIQGYFHLIAGTLAISDASHTLTIGGNFNNESTITNGNAKFIFNGNASQTIAANATQNFKDLELSGSGAKILAVDINILGSLTNNSVLNAGAQNISCKGDWGGTGSFTAGTSTVTLNGSISQRITKAVTFNNLIINNSSALNSISLNGIVTVNGNLTLTDGVVTTSTSKYIYLTNGATLTGGNEHTYISGLLRRAGSDDFIFPIGTSSYYAPLKISNLGSLADFSAQYFDVAPTNRSLLEVGLNSVSDAEYWNLTRNSGTATPKVSLYWNDRDFSGINDVDVLSVARYNTLVPEWQSYGVGSVNPSADTASGFITSDLSFDSFGKITFGFEYPTLVWNPAAGSTNFTDAANWTGGSSQAPSAQTNIRIPDVTGGDHPVVATPGQFTYNVLVQDGGILEIADNIELKVEGLFEVEALGTLILGANSSLTLFQNFTVYGTIQNNTNATLKFSGLVDQNIAFDSCYNVVFNGSAQKILNSDIVVKGNVSITNSLNPGSHTLTVMGNWINTGTFNSGTSTVILKGNSTQAITESSANGFYNLTVNNASATKPQITLNTNVLVSGALNLLDGVIQSTLAHEFRVGNNGTLLASSDSSYVDGPMYKYGVSNFVFPIGKNAIVAKLGISGMTGSGNFRAEYFDTKYADLDNIGVGLDKVTLIEYWDLSRPSGTATPYVTLYWSDSVRSGVSNHTALRVAHYYSGSWHNEGNGASVINADSSGYVRSSALITQFSPFTLGSADGSNPLPIELAMFSADVVDDNVEILWSTATEKNNHYFTVERMNNSGTIEQLYEISGAGNSNETLTYKVVDYNPVPGDSYYRLKQTDFDGKTVTFDWVAVNYWPAHSDRQMVMNVYPNPSNGQQVKLKASGIQAGRITCQVFNLLGELVNTEHFEVADGMLSQEWNLSMLENLNQGIYLIKVTDGVTEQLQRIIIK